MQDCGDSRRPIRRVSSRWSAQLEHGGAVRSQGIAGLYNGSETEMQASELSDACSTVTGLQRAAAEIPSGSSTVGDIAQLGKK
jgi:hypothetical protein